MSAFRDRVVGPRRKNTAVIVISLLLLTLFFTISLTAATAVPNVVTSPDGRLSYTIQQYFDSTWYTGIYLADMDYDGDPELLIGNRDLSELEIYRYEPQSNAMALIDSIEFPYHVHDIKAADFDHDGDMDIAVGLRNYGLYYAANGGSPGTIGTWSVTEIDGEYSLQVLAEDFDGDGNLDLFHGVDYGPIKTWYGDGTGSFIQGAPVEDSATDMRFTRGFDAVDLDGDDRLDLIGVDGSFLRAFLNPGDRSSAWESAGPTTAVGDYPCCPEKWLMADLSPSAGDLDGNGVVDQVANLETRPSGANQVLIFQGSTSGSDLVWTERVLDTIEDVGWAAHAGIADLDRDGNLDIHVGGAEKFNGLHVYLGDGQGGFTPETIELDHGVGGPNSFAAGDLNSDGSPDIVTIRYTSSGGLNSGFEVLFGSVNQPLLVGDQITLISKSTAGNQANGDSSKPSISADGRYVAFRSSADNLVAGGQPCDIVVYDRQLEQATCASQEWQDDTAYGGTGDDPVISADGRFVAFSITYMPSPVTNSVIYVYDRQTGQHETIAGLTPGETYDPTISADGRYVAFLSLEVGVPLPGAPYVFLHDRTLGQTTLVSVGWQGDEANGRSASPSISGDGRYLVFYSRATNVVKDVDFCRIVIYDREKAQATCASKEWQDDVRYLGTGEDPVISADGRYIAFSITISDVPPHLVIYVYDRETGQQEKIIGLSPGDTHDPTLSADGRYVAFLSQHQLMPYPGSPYVFLYDRFLDLTTQVSVGLNGEEPTGGSDSPTISADGMLVAFASAAENLVAGDNNGQDDIFLYSQVIHNGPLGDPEGLVSAGEYHSCGLRPDGRADCWGAELVEDDHGQAAGQAGPFVQVGAGALHSCGLRPNGSVDCWGTQEWYGQGADQSGPFSQIAVGLSHNCGLRPDGSVECWGGNWAGQAESETGPYVQLGAGWDHTCGLSPGGMIDCWGSNALGQAEDKAGPFAQVTVGGGHTCGLRLDGSVECWGRNGNGQAQNQNGPFVQITAGGRHTCGLTREGTVDCWGLNSSGQAESQAGPYVQISAGGTWMEGPDSWGHTCGLKSDGSIECWGSNRDGQAEAPSGQFGPYVPDTPTVVDAGGNHTCALLSDGTVHCWGESITRQLAGQEPQQGPFIAFATGLNHACGLTPFGQAVCWGDNNLGQAAGKDGPFKELSAGADYNCGLKLDGSVDCWAGDNDWGETVDQAGPFLQISSGTNHNCALKPDGSLFCWGKNTQGQTDQPAGLFQQLSAGGDHTCGLAAAGAVNCWGSNSYGQAEDRQGLYLQVSAGAYHSCALKLNGSAECWGRNNYGQAVDHAGPFSQISAGLYHTCGWRHDGSVECWGDNQHGQAVDQPGPFAPYRPSRRLPVIMRD